MCKFYHLNCFLKVPNYRHREKKKSWKEIDKNVNSCHILADNFFHVFLNAAFSKILNEFGQLLHYKKIKFRDNLCDLIGDPWVSSGFRVENKEVSNNLSTIFRVCCVLTINFLNFHPRLYHLSPHPAVYPKTSKTSFCENLPNLSILMNVEIILKFPLRINT